MGYQMHWKTAVNINHSVTHKNLSNLVYSCNLFIRKNYSRVPKLTRVHTCQLSRCDTIYTYSIQQYSCLGYNTFNLCGSFKDAMESLRHNALKSYFGLKKLIDWKYLKRSSIIKLIDVLVIPVLTNGCQSQIWMPYTRRKQYLQMLNPPNEDCSYLGGSNPIFPQDEIWIWGWVKMGKKLYGKRGKQTFYFQNRKNPHFFPWYAEIWIWGWKKIGKKVYGKRGKKYSF